jgi:hypothetical protein
MSNKNQKLLAKGMPIFREGLGDYPIISILDSLTITINFDKLYLAIKIFSRLCGEKCVLDSL